MAKEFTRFDIPQEVLEELLAPGYGDVETGVQQLEDELSLISVYARFPYATGKMVDWWFGTYLNSTRDYKLWSKDHISFKWDENKKPGTVVGGTHISEEYLGGELVPMRISFYDPADIFDVSRFEDANISCALVGEIRLPSGEVLATLLHIVRDTYYGCEMRNRIWARVPKEAAQGMLKHNMEEMGSLAEFLPSLYLRENQ